MKSLRRGGTEWHLRFLVLFGYLDQLDTETDSDGWDGHYSCIQQVISTPCKLVHI